MKAGQGENVMTSEQRTGEDRGLSARPREGRGGRYKSEKLSLAFQAFSQVEKGDFISF